MGSTPIHVIATTISGSIKDWSKVERIVPLFEAHGFTGVELHEIDSHAAARQRTSAAVGQGARTVISAGGSGTFNAVLEGCIDSGVPLGEIALGFLRKGSADLLGKALGMPDEIEEAIAVFATSLREGRTVRCDVLKATNGEADGVPRHFVGYGGAEIFGRVPHYTENRFTKYYKGVLSQLFGDLGPFFVGASLSAFERTLTGCVRGQAQWTIRIDSEDVACGAYQAMIIVNGDLGPDLPFAGGEALGSGRFHLFAIRDLGLLRLPGQFRRAWNASIMAAPEEWGFEAYGVAEELRLTPGGDAPFPVNVDGSTMVCRPWAAFRIMDQIKLISRD